MIEKNNDLVGVHAIVEFSECNLSEFCIDQGHTKNLVKTWVNLLRNINVETLGSHVHFFSQNSISLSLNLSESHLNFHTWPEFSYVAFDFFCCKKDENLKSDMENMINQTGALFMAEITKIIWVDRQFVVSF